MKSFLLSAAFLTVASFAQTAPPAIPGVPDGMGDSEVLATYGNGKQFTYGDAKMFLSALPEQQQQVALADRKEFVQKLILMLHMAELAAKAKLDEQSPAKEELYRSRVYTMSGAQFNEAYHQIDVSEADIDKNYKTNADRYTQVKVKDIYIRFSANPKPAPEGTKYLSETEAKAKADKIAAQLKAGADFVKLVKEHSEDEISAKKEGDFATIRRSDNVPEEIRKVLFALKKGEVSAPVRQPSGFYIFRAEEVGLRPLLEVKGDIITEIRQERLKQYVAKQEAGLNVKCTESAFFAKPKPATPAGGFPLPGPPPAK